MSRFIILCDPTMVCWSQMVRTISFNGYLFSRDVRDGDERVRGDDELVHGDDVPVRDDDGLVRDDDGRHDDDHGIEPQQ